MKNFVKIFFICVCLLISIVTNANGIDFDIQNILNNQPVISSEVGSFNENISQISKSNEKIFVSSNNQSQEIYSANLKRNSLGNDLNSKYSATSKISQQVVFSKYNRKIYNITHRWDLHLASEISTRAP